MSGIKISASKSEGKYWLLAFLVFLNFQPYFVWHFGYTMYLITLPTIVLCLALMDRMVFSRPYFYVWIFTVIVGALCSRNNIWGFIMTLLTTCSVFILRREAFCEVYRKLYLIYTITILISLLMWVLVVQLSVSVPFRIVEPLIALKDYDYSVYPFLVRINVTSFDFESLSAIYRFHGLYDEPGVVGTVSFLFLAAERFNMRKWLNIVLLISGLLSMSLFFYLAAALYSVFLLFTNRTMGFKARIALIIIFVGFVVYSYNDELLGSLVWSRIEGRESAQSFVDSRASEELQSYVSQIAYTSDWFFGASDRSLIERFSASASIYNAIIGYGVVTIVLFLFFFTIYSFRYSPTKRSAFVSVALIAVTVTQRPGLFVLYYLFLFRGLVLIPSDTENDEELLSDIENDEELLDYE